MFSQHVIKEEHNNCLLLFIGIIYQETNNVKSFNSTSCKTSRSHGLPASVQFLDNVNLPRVKIRVKIGKTENSAQISWYLP